MRRWLVLVAFLLACVDHPNQLVITFDTDAPLPPASGVELLDGPTPLFDRLRVDVVRPDGTICDGCTNDFAITSEMFAAGAASIGVPLPSADGWTLRARLYVARFTHGGEPAADATLDTVVSLPRAADNPGSAGVFLSTDTVGVPAASPVALGPVPQSSAVGSWPGAATIGCDETGLARPANTACVRGGAYWMGTQDGQSVSGRNGGWHRLAVISPHYVDVAEVTVGAFRAHSSQKPIPNDPSSTSKVDYCTYTPSGLYDALPVTCLTAVMARSYCNALGGDLPTGAQFERLATRFGRSPYVWGFDQPACVDAVFSNCSTTKCYFGIQPAAPCFSITPSPLMNVNGPIGGPIAPPVCTPDAACPLRDALTLGDAVVVDLAGNVAEYTADRAFAENDTCFTPSSGNVLVDPTCPMTDTVQARAGAFSVATAAGLRGDVVVDLVATSAGPDIGFRCVYPATPLR